MTAGRTRREQTWAILWSALSVLAVSAFLVILELPASATHSAVANGPCQTEDYHYGSHYPRASDCPSGTSRCLHFVTSLISILPILG